ncbi:MAG TPA: hypothetical protein VHE12_10375 [bacterium]|nr:hypothetical protein [bacterium]
MLESLKLIVSTLMGILGGYFMYRGKKIQNVQMILWGGALIVLSYLIFSGGNDEEAAKTALKGLGISVTPTLQTP